MKPQKKGIFLGFLSVLVISGLFFITCENDTTSNPETVVKPTATPAGSNYSASQVVTLATTTSGADIYYTLDGSTPTSDSSKYTAPVTISTSSTLKAIAIKSGMSNSDVLTEIYTITQIEQVAKPAANPPLGLISSGTNITLSTSTLGATIHYTTNGSDPTANDNVYTNPISITSDTTIKAIAVKSGMTDSEILEASYIISIPIATIIYNSNEILQNGTVDVDACLITQFMTRTITIINTGTETLTVDTTNITITGTDASSFTISTNPASSINAGDQSILDITFSPSTPEGVKNAVLTIPTNDPNRNPIIINLMGLGEQGQPIIEISQGGTIIAKNNIFDFGNVDTNEIKDITFSIHNHGNIDLSFITVDGNRINLTDNNSGSFLVIMQPSSATTVDPGSSRNFTIRFLPTTAGEFTSTVTIETNSSTNNPFTFTVKGTGQ